MKTRRIASLLLLIVFGVTFVAALFYFPYNRERLYRVIPPEAVVISEHERLAERWPTLARNPLVQSLLRSLGVKDKALATLATDPEIARLVKRVAPRHAVLTYVPALRSTGRPAWVLSSWLGSSGQARRMEMTMGMIPGFSVIRLSGGRKAWLLDADPKASSRDRLAVAVVEGVLVGCLSADPFGLEELVDRVDSRADVIPELAARLDRKRADADALDRGSLKSRWGIAPEAGLTVWRWTLTAVEETRLAGALTSDLALPWTGPALAGGDSAAVPPELAALLRDKTAALLVAPFASLKPLATSLMSTGVAEAVEALLGTNVVERAPAWVAVAGTNDCGRLFGFKVPTLVAAVRLDDPSRAEAMISAGLDRLNARFGLGLIVRPAEGADASRLVVEGVTRSVYKRLGSGEHVAFAVCGNWLLFCSNREALDKLLPRGPADRGGGGETALPGPRAGDLAHLRVDLAAAGDALAKGLAVYSLITLVDRGKSSTPPRAVTILRAVADAIEPLKPMETLAADLVTAAPQAEFRFALGPSSP